MAITWLHETKAKAKNYPGKVESPLISFNHMLLSTPNKNIVVYTILKMLYNRSSAWHLPHRGGLRITHTDGVDASRPPLRDARKRDDPRLCQEGTGDLAQEVGIGDPCQ